MKKFDELISYAIREGFSDIHIMGGHPIVFRKDGNIAYDKQRKWAHQEIDNLINEMLSSREIEILKQRLSVDLARSIQMIRIRVNIFNTIRGLSVAIRLLPGKAPNINKLNLHPSLKDYCYLPNGLILVGGATGSGKSTTIAAMVEEINRTRSLHIITLEDPIEYRFLSNKSVIQQREIGTHVPTYERGLLDVLREDPDVIVVGELREPEAIRLTLNAVESGHLVITSFHGTNTEEALHRICNSFPSDAQDMVRNQLASTLAVLIIQKLIFHPKAGYRVPVLSILRGTQAVKGVIRDNRFAQIEGTIQTGRRDNMFTMDQYKEDFIDKLNSFIPPSQSFRAYAAPMEDSYTSTIMTPDKKMAQKTDSYLKSEEKDKNISVFKDSKIGHGDQDAGIHYVIEEEASMDQVLAEIYNKPDNIK